MLFNPCDSLECRSPCHFVLVAYRLDSIQIAGSRRAKRGGIIELGSTLGKDQLFSVFFTLFPSADLRLTPAR